MERNDTPQHLPPHLTEDEIHLSDYVSVLYRRRRIALLAFLAVAFGVALYTFLSPPIYEASATLQVRSDKVRGAGNLLGDLGLSRDNPIETEIEIVKSRTNVEDAVRALRFNWIVDKKSEGLSFRLVDFISASERPEYRIELTGGGTFLVRNSDGKTVAEGKSGSLARSEGFSLLIDDLQGKPGDRFQLTLAPFNRTVQDLRNAVRVSEVGRGTSIIRLSYQHTDPQVARDVVNALAQAYLERSIILKTQEASRSVEFIGDQLVKVRETLHLAEERLEGYKSSTGVVRLDSEAQALITHLAEAEKGQTAARLRLRQAEFAVDSLRSALDRRESYAPAILLDEPVVASLARNLADLEIERRGLLVELSTGHPAVQAVQDRIAELQRNLLGTYTTIVSGLREMDADLTRNLQRYEAGLKKLPAAELELARLSRTAAVNADIYTFLLQKHEEARIAKASTISNINVIDPAIAPDLPVKPQKKKNLLLGLIVGGMVGVGLAFFREYLDDSIKDADTAKRLLGLPVLGIIPFIEARDSNGKSPAPGSDRVLITNLQPNSPVSEAFRSLRTSLHFSGAGKENKVILITSTFPGEGKTTTSSNLAHTIAQTGSRVLIIGCDLRRPTLHQLFGTTKVPGLTEVLIGDATVEEALKKTDRENFDFIPGGTIPPNPAELLGSEKMAELIETLRGRYDVILLDAPPVLAVTDAVLLTRLADLNVIVLHAGGVGAKAAQRMVETLRATRSHIAGLVLNDRTAKAAEYYGSGYSNRYGYTYGYGENLDAEKKKPWWRFGK
jgi:tyrosine-protein kinase Etk/Wzc